MASHEMFDGRLQVYRRGGRYWQCAARVEGQRFRESTKEESLDLAKQVAEDWYLELRGKMRAGLLKKKEHTFAMVADEYPHASQKELDVLLDRAKVFPSFERAMFNTILDEKDLKFDRDGQRRTAYSLRHTYICIRLMEGAPIHMLANNCRTSPQMIEEHYAAHIKDRLNASLLNVQRPRRARKPRKADNSHTASL